MSGFANFLLRHRLPLLGGVFVLVLVCVLGWNFRRPRHDPRLEAIRKAGYPVTLAELDDWYPRVPDAENAALIYTNAFELMMFTGQGESNRTQIGDIKLPPRGQTLMGEDKSELASMIASNAAALRLLYSAQPLTNSRYPIDLKQGLLTPLPHLTKVKAAVRLLSAEAVLHIANGEHEPAVQSLLAATHVANSLNSEPLLISQLVRIACWAIIVSHLENVVNATALADKDLARLQITLDEAEQRMTASRELAGERACGLATFDEPQMRAEMLIGWPFAMATMVERLKASGAVFLLRVTGFFEKDRRYFLDALKPNIATASLNYPERFSESQRAAAAFNAVPRRFYISSSMLLPALSRYYIRDAEHATRVRVAQTALAIERHRLAHANALPATLDELVPAYLKVVPTDPCDGQQLRFKKLEKGYVVYGVGTDGVDDGGLERKTGGGQSNYDVTFIVEH